MPLSVSSNYTSVWGMSPQRGQSSVGIITSPLGVIFMRTFSALQEFGSIATLPIRHSRESGNPDPASKLEAQGKRIVLHLGLPLTLNSAMMNRIRNFFGVKRELHQIIS